MGYGVWEEEYGAEPVERGCGVRVEDGVYSECGLSPFGKPIEEFLIEGVPLPPELENLPAIGVTLVEVDGVWHIVDHVSEDQYPSPADMIEEVRRFGMSRRAEGIDYSKITKESKHILVHPRARIANLDEYGSVQCPHEMSHGPGEMCAGAWWADLDGDDVGDGRVKRKRPSFTYEGGKRPKGVVPEYERGFIAAFPITRMVVVNGERAEQKMASVSQAKVPTRIVPE